MPGSTDPSSPLATSVISHSAPPHSGITTGSEKRGSMVVAGLSIATSMNDRGGGSIASPLCTRICVAFRSLRRPLVSLLTASASALQHRSLLSSPARVVPMQSAARGAARTSRKRPHLLPIRERKRMGTRDYDMPKRHDMTSKRRAVARLLRHVVSAVVVRSPRSATLGI